MLHAGRLCASQMESKERRNRTRLRKELSVYGHQTIQGGETPAQLYSIYKVNYSQSSVQLYGIYILQGGVSFSIASVCLLYMLSLHGIVHTVYRVGNGEIKAFRSVELICYSCWSTISFGGCDRYIYGCCVCVCFVHISQKGGVSHPMSFRLTGLVCGSTGLSVSFLLRPYVLPTVSSSTICSALNI